MLDRAAVPIFRKVALLMTLPVVLLALLVVAGCGAARDVVLSVSVSHPVWMSDGWVYYLREVSSEGAEVWRQREGEADKRILGTEDIAGVCKGATFSFLFRATDDDLGIATECADGITRMELTMYSPERMSFSHIASTPFLGGVAFHAGRTTGYVEQPTGCGTAIRPIQDGIVGEFARPITVTGKSWMLSGAEPPACGSVAWSRSPTLAPDGSVFFLTAPDSIGKLPITDPNALDEFEWYLCSWDDQSAAVRVVTTLRGVADLAMSPNGRFVLAAVSTSGAGGISMVDTATGKIEEVVKDQQAYHPSLSPDGSRFVYVENLRQLRFGSLPGATS
ncbi:MAG: TolB family protein [Pseudonocardiaceae bacterium]